MAHIKKILKMQVGEYIDQTGKTSPEMREIGVVIEHERNGDTWLTLKLHADILNPVLFQMVRPFSPKGSSGVTVKLYDLARRKAAPDDDGDMETEKPF
jgi:hypothetical protein